ncbi:transposase [Pandoraea sp.]|uniref:transposase n=1 Tax=Pandoraea sp. TaxID=1883445 RepID=UPI0035AF65BF
MIGAITLVLLIVNDHPIRKSKHLSNYVTSHDGRVKPFYLPPYAPQLNPDEQVKAHVKRHICPRLA